ncbi:protein-disulfide reductase DsbD [Thioalkalicoccus limnaeus]|uniref:Thiol:disulfide interchange protein DsbD n=1 Tax=Thioalkalicoccus limnaeus TaxID=120681 RepID=A0ABV4BAJ3_9GAMM
MKRLGLAVLLWSVVALALASDDFLHPDQAFRLAGQAAGADAVTLNWDIADGYYLYQSKLAFRSVTDGIEVGEVDLPPAEVTWDEFFGDVSIYRDRLIVEVPVLRRDESGDRVALEVTYQGCAEAGLCYPPQRQTLEIALRPTGDARAEEQASPEVSSAPLSSLRDRASAALARLTGARLADELLPVDEAFRFAAAVVEPDLLRATWDIAPGTSLYQAGLALSLEGPPEVGLGAIEWPRAEVEKDTVLPDGGIGDAFVYRDRLDLEIPLSRGHPGAAEITLVAKYQGCADLGICYPPVTTRVALTLPETELTSATTSVATGTVAMPSATSADPEPVSEVDRLAAVLAGGNLWAIVALFFGLGLLLSLTPCVFPMIPILSGIIAGQGPGITTRRAFVLSVVYVLAMALTYTVAGVLAGLFGANLQAAFQNVWVLATFAAIFVALALSMFGFYELQLPTRVQTRLTELSHRQRGGTLTGVAVMGLLSALIIGPCVAPPLAGALIFIGQTGDAVLGGLALFALSLGMGAPLVAVGTSAGRILPRAGAWMESIKAVFGVLLLAVAVWLLERVLSPSVAMALWGTLLICSAVYMGALHALPAESSGWARLWKGLGLVLLVYGVLMLVGAAAGGRDTLQPLRGLISSTTGIPTQAQFRAIKTVEDLDQALADARVAGRPVMLDFYADWCVECRRMERTTFSDPEVIAELARFVLLKADITANDAEDQALLQGRFGLPGPPAIIFWGADGAERRGYRIVGYLAPGPFADHLRKAAS